MVTKKLIRIIFILFFAVACYSNLGSFTKDSNSAYNQTFVFISDTQTPMWFEELFVKNHRNEEATQILLNNIASDSAVSAVFMLGDVTAMSSINDNWAHIDSFLIELSKRDIPAYAVMGNHDCLLKVSTGELNFKKRFPAFVKTGYTVRIKQLAVAMLNSNFSEMSCEEIKYQDEWYKKELDRLEQDSTVQIIIVGCHHSPYCNSSIVGSSKKVRNKFVAPFMQIHKCKLFLSGHAHTFQHFIDTLHNKHFLVIGGGGGLLHKLDGDECHGLKDQVKWDKDYRMFHYLRCNLTNKKLSLNVMMLKENLGGPYPVYEINLPLNDK